MSTPPGPRILNLQELASHGDRRGRRALLEILEAGLQASNPYHNTLKAVRREGTRLIVGGSEFELEGDRQSGYEEVDLKKIDRIFVFGAAKGVQHVARALEHVLGDRLSGGHVIDKRGHPLVLDKIEVTLGAHPVPDEACVQGCQRIVEMSRGLTANDLVFSIVGNGVSSLLTLPAPGIALEDVRKVTHLMQVERGVPTRELNPIRNHLDLMKGGRISRHFRPARVIHLLITDPVSFTVRIYGNVWLHTLPDTTGFQDAVSLLKKWEVWEEVPASVRRHLERADPEMETVKPAEFLQMGSRIFALMPPHLTKLPAAMNKAQELGFKPVLLARELHDIEASQAALYLTAVARTVERTGQPAEPPCALFASGEMVVTVGKHKGIGGRNQEMVLASAMEISGSRNILIGSVDTDGTDGPGDQFVEGYGDIPCLAGGIVDGTTLAESRAAGIDIAEELRRHNTSPPLRKLNSGIVASPNVSLVDLTVALVMGRNED